MILTQKVSSLLSLDRQGLNDCWALWFAKYHLGFQPLLHKMLRRKFVPEIHRGSLTNADSFVFSRHQIFRVWVSPVHFLRFCKSLHEAGFLLIYSVSHPSQVSESLVVIHVSVKPLFQVSVLDHCELTEDPSQSKTCNNRPKEHPKICIFYKCWDGADAAQVASRLKSRWHVLSKQVCANAGLCLCCYL